MQLVIALLQLFLLMGPYDVSYVVCSSSAVAPHEFTWRAGSSLSSFALQSLTQNSHYPFVTKSEGCIYLTEDPASYKNTTSQFNVGRITYNLSTLPFKDASNQLLSFSTSFTFNITTVQGDAGNGIAFVLTTDPSPPKYSSGGYLGLMPHSYSSPPNSDEALITSWVGRFMAVEFDTYKDTVADINDPSSSHIGIDISNLSSDVILDTSSDPSHPLYLHNNYTITAWVSYNASDQLIQVWAINRSNVDGQLQRPLTPILTFTHNLSQVFEGYTTLYPGITAASGASSQAIILYSWSFSLVDDQRQSEFYAPQPAPANGQGNGPSPRGHKHMPLWVWVLVAVAVLPLVVAVVLLAVARRRKLEKREYDRDIEAAIQNAAVSVRKYRYEELKRATQNFNDAMKIGVGGFGHVYRGKLSGETSTVAIKKLMGLVDKWGQPARDNSGKQKSFISDQHRNLLQVFAREIEMINRTRHCRLLELKGWCWEKGEALLVLEYMPQGNLDQHLHDKEWRNSKGQSELGSETRFKILQHVAEGLEYLHHGLSLPILHRDVKAANVLLTEGMEAKLCDFGLAYLKGETMSTEKAAGTSGYMAPEVFKGEVTEKGDVYSFGVLALEVATGRKAVDRTSPTFSQLVNGVRQSHQQENFLECLDPSLDVMQSNISARATNDIWQLNMDVKGEELQKWRCVLHLGLLCTQEDPEKRPLMKEVLQALRNQTLLPVPNSFDILLDDDQVANM